jgi:hypothetical protein
VTEVGGLVGADAVIGGVILPMLNSGRENVKDGPRRLRLVCDGRVAGWCIRLEHVAGHGVAVADLLPTGDKAREKIIFHSCSSAGEVPGKRRSCIPRGVRHDRAPTEGPQLSYRASHNLVFAVHPRRSLPTTPLLRTI